MTMMMCSFCGCYEDSVDNFIRGPGGILICNVCVDLCNEILHKRLPEAYSSEQDALVAIIEMERASAEAKFRDADKAETWATVIAARKGLRAGRAKAARNEEEIGNGKLD